MLSGAERPGNPFRRVVQPSFRTRRTGLRESILRFLLPPGRRPPCVSCPFEQCASEHFQHSLRGLLRLLFQAFVRVEIKEAWGDFWSAFGVHGSVLPRLRSIPIKVFNNSTIRPGPQETGCWEWSYAWRKRRMDISGRGRPTVCSASMGSPSRPISRKTPLFHPNPWRPYWLTRTVVFGLAMTEAGRVF